MKVHVVHLVSSELIEYSTSLLLWLRRELRPWEVEEKALEDTGSGWSSSEESGSNLEVSPPVYELMWGVSPLSVLYAAHGTAAVQQG